MWIVTLFITPHFFEPVDVVTKLSTSQQAGIGHVIQVPECGCLVDAALVELRSNVRMCHRSGRIPQQDQCGNASWRGAQAD